MTLGLLLLSLWGCRSTPPELASQAAALASFRAAESALEAGDPARALRALDEALAHRPADLLLKAWRAQILAETDLPAALAELDAVAAAHPQFGEARYNRAAYLARSGRIDEAGAELAVALRLGVTTVPDARADPDFAAHLAHPAMAHLALPLTVSLGRLPERVFRGSELVVRLTAETEQPVALSGGVSGPVELVRVVEDHRGDAVHLEFTLDTARPGQVAVGPLELSSGDREPASVQRHEVSVVGPDASGRVQPGEVVLEAPTQWAAGLTEARPIRRNDTVVVKVAPVDRVQTTPSVPPISRHELRSDGQPEWVAWVYPPEVTEVVVRGSGGERYRGPVLAAGE